MKKDPAAQRSSRPGASSRAAARVLPGTLDAEDGTALHVHHWPVPKPQGTFQLLHGLCEHAGRFDELAGQLNAAGWAAVAIDHRGHGRSGGPRGALSHNHDLLRDQARLHDVIALAYPDMPHMLLGTSMGGAVAARMVSAAAVPEAGEPWARPWAGLVLAAPALQPTLSVTQRALLSSLGRLVPDLAVPVGFRPEWVTSNPDVVKEMETDPLIHDRLTPRIAQFLFDSGEMVFARAERWNVPTLLLYSKIDRLVAPEGCERFIARAPKQLVQVRAYADLKHDLFHEPGRARAFDDVLGWLAGLEA